MLKQPCFDKRPPGVIVKKPAAGPVWLLLGLTAVLLAAMTRKAYGCAFPRQTSRPNTAGRRNAGWARPRRVGAMVCEVKATGFG
jgi:hypothetical protein